MDPNDTIPIPRLLKTMLVGSAIIDCTFEDVVSSDLIARLLPELSCPLSTFSMHFVF